MYREAGMTKIMRKDLGGEGALRGEPLLCSSLLLLLSTSSLLFQVSSETLRYLRVNLRR